jgi:dTDP-glucose 4,6-dehydratase
LAALIGIPYSYDSAQSYVDVNVTGTLNILEAARAHSVGRVVHTSTSEVYGTAQYVPIDEKHPLQGQSPYSASKIAADKLGESFAASFGTPVVVLRPFNTYGPRQSARAVIPAIITQALAGEEVALGNLEPTRDFTYVADTVDGFLAAASSQAAVGQVVNLGTGNEISIGDLVTLIGELLGREIQVRQHDDRKRPGTSEVERLNSDNRLARELLGWQPRTSLRDGLSATIEWIEQNLSRYHVGTYAV